MGRRFEAPHLALALPCRLMRHLRPVVRVLRSAVLHGRHHGSVGGRVAAHLVGDQLAGETTLFLQQFSKESDRGTSIPSRLDQDIKDVTVLIHGSPQVLLATIDRHEEFVEVPGIAEPTAPVPEPSGVGAPEGVTPLPNRLVGDRNTTLGEEVFDIAEAQAEAKVEPDGVGDDVGRKSISVVARRGTVHPVTLILWTST